MAFSRSQTTIVWHDNVVPLFPAATSQISASKAPQIPSNQLAPPDTRRVLVIAEAGYRHTNHLWGATECAADLLEPTKISYTICRRLAHEGVGSQLVDQLSKTGLSCIYWLNEPSLLVEEASGFDTVITVEFNQLFRTVPFIYKNGLTDGWRDYEPTLLEAALQQLHVPVIRIWIGPEDPISGLDFEPPTPVPAISVHDYNNGLNALVRFRSTWEQVKCAAVQQLRKRFPHNYIGWAIEEFANKIATKWGLNPEELKQRSSTEVDIAIAKVIAGALLHRPARLAEDAISEWLAI